MTCTLIVNPGLVAYVDDEDAPVLRRYTWYRIAGRNTIYAATWIEGQNVRLHKLILNHWDEEPIDHINGNGLDCRKNNMRITTNEINGLNRRSSRGVSEKETARGLRYQAAIRFEGRVCYLGQFKSEAVAKRVYELNKRRIVNDLRPVAYKGGHRLGQSEWVVV